MTAGLHHEIVGEGEGARERAYFLHGILGAGRNWRSLARRFVERRPGWAAVLVDLRLHGASRGFEPPHTLEACAGDLRRLARTGGRAMSALLGHSFGGKVVLQYLREGERDAGGPPDPGGRDPGSGVGDGGSTGLPAVVWVVDSTPSRREPGGNALRMLRTLREEPGPFESREEAVETVARRGFGRPVGEWMATNLLEGEGGYVWRFDLDAVEELLADFFRTDLWDVVEDPPAGVELHFFKAEDSEVLPEEECRRLEAAGRGSGRVHLHRLEGGHWLNVANPDGLLRGMEEATG